MATRDPRHGRAQASRRRILRIGVLLGGKIVEERLIRDRSAVSLGQSSKNTFAIPLESLPREWTLFSLDNDAYRLNFTPKMDGRVSDGAQVYTFEQVKGTKAVQHGDHWTMPLTDQARGKVSIGDLTLLFQFVTEPPVQPKPMLPASVRGSLAERLDPRLAVICAISIVIHFGLALAAWMHDVPKKRWGRTLQKPPSEVATVDIQPVDVPLPEAEATDTADTEQPGAAEAKAEDKPKARGDSRPKSADPGRGRKEVDAASLQEEAARYASALAAASEGPGGVDGRMSRTAPGGDLNQQIKETRDSGASIKVGGASDRQTRGDGDPRIGTGKGPKLDGTTTTTGTAGGKDEKVPTGRIKVDSKQSLDDSSLTADSVLARIQSVYMAGLKRCYKNLLKSDPTARGKVTLSFTVNEKGRVTSPSAKSEFSELSGCIEGQMKTWTFPIPKDSDGDATDAAFKVSLALQPD
jgi:hypothetical protein